MVCSLRKALLVEFSQSIAYSRCRASRRLRHSDGRRSATLISFSRHNLVVVGSKTHSERSPGLEVVGSSDSSAGALGTTDGPVLIECSSARDGRLVNLLVGVDVVDGSIAGNSSLQGHAASGVVGAIAFQNVVLDEGAGGPAIDSEVRITRWIEGSREVDVSLYSNMLVIDLSFMQKVG